MTVDDLAYQIGTSLARWGRITIHQTKNKWGEARVYCSFGWYQLQSIFYPKYVYIQKPKWLMNLSLPEWINHIVLPYQRWIYKIVYKRYIKLYPEFSDSIIDGMDYPELIGIKIPNLCRTHSLNDNIRCYWVDPEDCDECKKFNDKLQEILE
jgi:hypothetical protein